MGGQAVDLLALVVRATGMSHISATIGLSHGTFWLNGECLGLPDKIIQRDRLSGALLKAGGYTFRINDEATCLHRQREDTEQQATLL